MITIKWQGKWEGDKVNKRLDDATFKSLNHAAATLRLIARRSIRRSKTPSAPGTPPHSGTGQLRNSIVYHLDKKRHLIVCGPNYSSIAAVGAVHEFGEVRFGQRYPKRAFMKPALEKITPRLPSMWAASF